MRHRTTASSRSRTENDRYGVLGTSACASKSHPRNGRAGLVIRGFRSTRHVLTYQSVTAATPCHKPIANSTLIMAAKTRENRTEPGEAQMTSIFGNRRVSGLAHGFGNTPARENNSGPQATRPQ